MKFKFPGRPESPGLSPLAVNHAMEIRLLAARRIEEPNPYYSDCRFKNAFRFLSAFWLKKAENDSK